jgi:UDP-N-acetyl-D-mannosaminuronate dehydrogenase
MMNDFEDNTIAVMGLGYVGHLIGKDCHGIHR